MEINVYTVYDSKTNAYMQPWYARTRGEAIRSFTEAIQNPESMFHKYPGDFTLFEVGTWDDQTGAIQMLEAKQEIGLALHFKRVEESSPIMSNREPRGVELTQ